MFLFRAKWFKFLSFECYAHQSNFGNLDLEPFCMCRFKYSFEQINVDSFGAYEMKSLCDFRAPDKTTIVAIL